MAARFDYECVQSVLLVQVVLSLMFYLKFLISFHSEFWRDRGVKIFTIYDKRYRTCSMYANNTVTRIISTYQK